MTPREFLEFLRTDPSGYDKYDPGKFNRNLRAWVDDDSGIARFVRAYEEANPPTERIYGVAFKNPATGELVPLHNSSYSTPTTAIHRARTYNYERGLTVHNEDGPYVVVSRAASDWEEEEWK